MLAIMPASLAAHYARLGVLQVVPVELPLQVPPIHLVMRRQRELSPAALGFLEVLRARVSAGAHAQ
jgi:DNA-binding transcriptional LysR family regulator